LKHDETDPNKIKYWSVYFIDEIERNIFITQFKNVWEILFQVPLTIQKCKSSEMSKRCKRNVKLIHRPWINDDGNDNAQD
jgi:hypothetical protein